MPFYDYQCTDCDWTDEHLFQRSVDASDLMPCSVCGGVSKKQFPLVRFNLYNEDYEPHEVNRRTLNPERMMSDKPGAGADYAIRYHEITTQESRLDCHDYPNAPMDRPIHGTVRWQEWQKAKRGH
jgi:putative FmdB family regulatory protein